MNAFRSTALPPSYAPPTSKRFQPPRAGAASLVLTLLSGASWAWIAFQVVLGVTVGVSRLIAGGPSFAIISGSMAPTLPEGSVVATRRVESSELPVYSVITFRDPADPGRITTHRIIDFDDGAFITKGDANLRVDSTPVPPENVIGRTTVVIPFVALPVVWWIHNDLTALGAWVGSCLVAATFIALDRRLGRRRWRQAVRRITP